MKKNRPLLVMTLVFLALLAAVLLQDQSAPTTGDPTPSSSLLQRIFPELEVARIQAIRLQLPGTGETITLARSREDGSWTILGSEGTNTNVLDAEAATLIARTLVLLPYRRSFTIEEGTDMRQFGFRPGGDFLIQFITMDGEEHVVAIGEPSFDSPTFYGVVDNRMEVYLIERPAIDFLVNYFIEPTEP